MQIIFQMEFLSGTSFLYQYVLSVCRASEVVLVVKNLPANVRDIKNAGSISGLERSPEVGNGNVLQYSCLENSMDRGAWKATVQGVTMSCKPMKQLSTQNSSTAAAAAKSLQSCLTLCDPIDGSPPGSPVPGILQARTLEWVAISFSNA